MHIVLHQPEIPANTGNIGRTCVATGTSLHLIEPLGFHLDEKSIRRAGMDYWEHLDVTRYVNFEEFRQKHPGARIWMATTKARRSYTEVEYGPDDYIMFGKESAGIPEEILVEHEKSCIRIPMLPDIRSLNLANSVAIVLYEALRQQGFAGLQEEGALHRLAWKDETETGNAAYISPCASLSGDITLGSDASVWHHATLRADSGPIRIGRGSNIQDNAVLHMDPGGQVELGEYVTVGHSAVVHGCRVGDNTLIGMGAIIMNHARIGRNCIIGAGALVTQGMEIPDNSLVIGSPARIKREVTPEEAEKNLENARYYIEEARHAFGPAERK
ncbi:MAG: hypothetical protein J6B43_08560 [Lachnospiraceae bacterium]|nr:hypothetical protein [Lachnospiraceae bacterium]